MKTLKYPPGEPVFQNYSTVPATSDAKEYLNLLLKHKFGLLATLLLGVFLAWLYLISTTPVYQANTLLEIKDRVNFERSTVVDYDKPTVKEESNILYSRRVLQPVMDRFQLQRSVKPQTLPVLYPLAQKIPYVKDWLTGFKPVSAFAWGADNVEISLLDLPSRWEDEKLQLTILDAEHFSLERDGLVLVERAAVGQSVHVNLVPLEPLRIVVSSINSTPGVRFDVSKKSVLATLLELQNNMQTETSDTKSRMITVTLKGKNPVKTAEILNAITEEYIAVKLGSESREIDKELQLYAQSMPKVKQDLKEAEAALAQARRTSGTVDTDVQRRSLLRQIEMLESDLIELQLDKEELKERYSDLHPSTKRLDKEMRPIQQKLRELRGRVNAIPTVELDLNSLEEKESAARKLFNEMDQQLQKLRLEKDSLVTSVVLWDKPIVPKSPISPQPMIALVSGIFGMLFLYTLFLTLRSALSTVISDQESLERASGLPVFINIPRSSAQKKLTNSSSSVNSKHLLPGKADQKPADTKVANILAVQKPDDYSVENMRGFRLMLEDVMDSASNNVMMICSPLPNMGKSFVSANLAALLAQSGKRVLLVDADYMRGQQHKAFGFTMGPGLPEVVQGQSDLKDTVKATSVPNLYIIPRGFMSTGNTRQIPDDKDFGAFLQVVAPRFDMVVIDTPPILSVSTAATLGKHVGSSFMVVKEGEIKESQLVEALKRLSFSGVRVDGCLLNSSLQTTPSHYAYYREQTD